MRSVVLRGGRGRWRPLRSLTKLSVLREEKGLEHRGQEGILDKTTYACAPRETRPPDTRGGWDLARHMHTENCDPVLLTRHDERLRGVAGAGTKHCSGTAGTPRRSHSSEGIYRAGSRAALLLWVSGCVWSQQGAAVSRATRALDAHLHVLVPFVKKVHALDPVGCRG